MDRKILLLVFLFSSLAVAAPSLQCQLDLSDGILNPGSHAVADVPQKENSAATVLSFSLSGWGCQASAAVNATTHQFEVVSLGLTYEGGMVRSETPLEHVDNYSLSALLANDFAFCTCSTKPSLP